MFLLRSIYEISTNSHMLMVCRSPCWNNDCSIMKVHNQSFIIRVSMYRKGKDIPKSQTGKKVNIKGPFASKTLVITFSDGNKFLNFISVIKK